jgi:MFS family permease
MRFRLPDDSTTPTRSSLEQSPDGTLYLESWLLLRLVVGLLGLLLPLLLIAGEALLFPGNPVPRSSLSAYYHSGMRDAFVAVLCVVGVFLVTYMALHWNWDNAITILAGLAAIAVALLPTSVDRGATQTPLQLKFGQDAVAHVHFGAAVLFVVLLAVMSYRFGLREGRRGNPRHRRWHVTLAGAMAAALLLQLAAEVSGVRTVLGVSVLLLVEVACTLAFGASWLLKGAELSRALVRRGFYGAQARAQRRDLSVAA